MTDDSKTTDTDALQRERAAELFRRHQQSIHERTDRLFARLMPLQWLGAVILAVWVSPLTWSGEESRVHLHVWLAILFGGAITLYPVLLALTRTGQASTRHVIAVGQMLMSALLIHITGGRIETHFHVFGSLAFLAFYRDWRVFIPATVVVGLDHFLRGVFWPQSVYGVLVASPWRAVEHTAWVVFEDVFLTIACRQSIQEMRDIAAQRASLEFTNQRIERTVAQRTQELRSTLQELARSNGELTQFAYAASHDLQEPLRKIVSFGDMLSQHLNGNLDAKARDFLQRMQRSAVRMETLIEDLLTLARVSSDTEPYEVVELGAVTREVLSDLEARITESGGRVEVGRLPTLKTHPLRMRQLLQNLISNALKFHRKDQPPRVIVKGRKLSNGFCEITVQDNGIGIEDQHLSRIFKPFQRLNSRVEHEGNGMGLTICEKIVSRHGGNISVKSVPGTGSLFTVLLSAAPPGVLL